MHYIILYLKRHPLLGVRTMAHPIVYDDADAAEIACMECGDMYKAPAWIVSVEKPDVRPQLKAVN